MRIDRELDIARPINRAYQMARRTPPHPRHAVPLFTLLIRPGSRFSLELCGVRLSAHPIFVHQCRVSRTAVSACSAEHLEANRL